MFKIKGRMHGNDEEILHIHSKDLYKKNDQ